MRASLAKIFENTLMQFSPFAAGEGPTLLKDSLI